MSRTIVCVVVLAFVAGALAGNPTQGPAKQAPSRPAPSLPALGQPCQVAKAGKGTCSQPTSCGLAQLREEGKCNGGVLCCAVDPKATFPRCDKAHGAFKNAHSVVTALMRQCRAVQKQSLLTCRARVFPKLEKLRRAINARACGGAGGAAPKSNKTKTQAKAQQRKVLVETAAAIAAADTPAAVKAGEGLINRLADFFVNKAAGTSSQQASVGCNFQTAMNCRAYSTDCAMECIGEPMGGCKACFNGGGHPAGAFEQCCQCDIVRQFGIPSCSY